jgi:hypothetical protein
MTHGIPQFTITNSDYGEVLHSTILKIFGDELTYNELEFYTRDKNATSYLEVKEERNNHEGFMFISVFVDKQKIMEAKYDVNWSCDMFNYLSELENEKEEEEDYCGEVILKDENGVVLTKSNDEDEEDEDEDYCGEAGSLNYLFGIPVKKFVVSDEVSDDEIEFEILDEPIVIIS